jgi:hypothetical protein
VPSRGPTVSSGSALKSTPRASVVGTHRSWLPPPAVLKLPIRRSRVEDVAPVTSRRNTVLLGPKYANRPASEDALGLKRKVRPTNTELKPVSPVVPVGVGVGLSVVLDPVSAVVVDAESMSVSVSESESASVSASASAASLLGVSVAQPHANNNNSGIISNSAIR